MIVLCDNCSPRKGCSADKNRTECRFYQPITNDQWRRTCSVEEFAKWVYDLIMHEGNTEWYEDLLDYREDIMDYRANYHLIEMWLKQPHIEKEQQEMTSQNKKRKARNSYINNGGEKDTTKLKRIKYYNKKTKESNKVGSWERIYSFR